MDWILEGLNDESLLDLGDAQQVRRFGRKSLVFQPGSDPEAIFVVQEGQVRLYMTDRSGKEFTINVLRPGDIFSGHTRCYGEALTDGRLAVLHRKAFLDVVLRHPAIAVRLSRVFGNSLRNAFDLIEVLAFRAVSSRLAWFLLGEADMHGTPTPEGVSIELALTTEQIASRIGSTRQTTSTLLNDLVRRGIVLRKERRLMIADREALLRLSAGQEDL